MSSFRFSVESRREPGYKPGSPFPCSSGAVHTFQLCPTAIQFVSLSRGKRESRADAIRARRVAVTHATCVRAVHALINAHSSSGWVYRAALVWLTSLRLDSRTCGSRAAIYSCQWQRRFVSSIWPSPLSTRDMRGVHPNFRSARIS